MEEMLKEVEQCKTIAAKRFNKPLAMTDEDQANFAKATTGCPKSSFLSFISL